MNHSQRNGAASPATIATGVAPPHSLEAEQSVLGGILLSDRAMYGLVIEEGLKADDFYRDRHRLIYESMIALYRESEPIDVLTVSEHLRSLGKLEQAGGKAAIDELTGGVPGLGGIRRYAQIVREHALMRRLLSTTYEIQASVLNHAAAPRELVELAEQRIFALLHRERAGRDITLGQAVTDELKRIEEASASDRGLHRPDQRPARPRRAHRRLAARQPHRARRTPGHGEVERGAELRHPRRVRGEHRGPVLLTGDEHQRDHPALPVDRDEHQHRPAAARQRHRRRTGPSSSTPAPAPAAHGCVCSTTLPPPQPNCAPRPGRSAPARAASA